MLLHLTNSKVEVYDSFVGRRNSKSLEEVCLLIQEFFAQSNRHLFLIYYTGHGINHTGDWVFKDGELTFEMLMELWNTRPAKEDAPLLTQGQHEPAREHLLVVSDCCFSGMWVAKARAYFGSFSPDVSFQSACQPWELAWDLGPGEGGCFTSMWLESKRIYKILKIRRKLESHIEKTLLTLHKNYNKFQQSLAKCKGFTKNPVHLFFVVALEAISLESLMEGTPPISGSADRFDFPEEMPVDDDESEDDISDLGLDDEENAAEMQLPDWAHHHRGWSPWARGRPSDWGRGWGQGWGQGAEGDDPRHNSHPWHEWQQQQQQWQQQWQQNWQQQQQQWQQNWQQQQGQQQQQQYWDPRGAAFQDPRLTGWRPNFFARPSFRPDQNPRYVPPPDTSKPSVKDVTYKEYLTSSLWRCLSRITRRSRGSDDDNPGLLMVKQLVSVEQEASNHDFNDATSIAFVLRLDPKLFVLTRLLLALLYLDKAIEKLKKLDKAQQAVVASKPSSASKSSSDKQAPPGHDHHDHRHHHSHSHGRPNRFDPNLGFFARYFPFLNWQGPPTEPENPTPSVAPNNTPRSREWSDTSDQASITSSVDYEAQFSSSPPLPCSFIGEGVEPLEKAFGIGLTLQASDSFYQLMENLYDTMEKSVSQYWTREDFTAILTEEFEDGRVGMQFAQEFLELSKSNFSLSGKSD